MKKIMLLSDLIILGGVVMFGITGEAGTAVAGLAIFNICNLLEKQVEKKEA